MKARILKFYFLFLKYYLRISKINGYNKWNLNFLTLGSDITASFTMSTSNNNPKCRIRDPEAWPSPCQYILTYIDGWAEQRRISVPD